MGRIITAHELSEATRIGPFCAIYQLTDGETTVKSGENTRLAEANTMKYVRDNTTIPVPEIYNAYIDEESGHVCIVMERVDGQTLQDAWETYDEVDKEAVVQQLRGYFHELRQIKGAYIGAVDGSACDDQYFSDNIGGYGPYATEAEFNQGLAAAWSKGREDDPFTRLLCRMQLQCMKSHEIVLTHNDFAPRNILVRGSEVVALLDWEFAGFYPEYWEYCKAMWRPDWESSWIKDGLVDRLLDLSNSVPWALDIPLNNANGTSLPPSNPIKDFIPVADEDKLRRLLREALPALSDRPFVDVKKCWFSDSKDSEYCIDFVPQTNKSLVILTGDSGHAFKMLPIFGKWVVGLLKDGKQERDAWKWRTGVDNRNWGNEVSWRVGEAKDLMDVIADERGQIGPC